MPTPIEQMPQMPVTERAEEASPLRIEKKEVVTPTPHHFSGQVYGDNGQPLITTPENKEVIVILPADPATITTGTKGSADDAQTWFFLFWARMVKQALLWGRKLVVAKT